MGRGLRLEKASLLGSESVCRLLMRVCIATKLYLIYRGRRQQDGTVAVAPLALGPFPRNAVSLESLLSKVWIASHRPPFLTFSFLPELPLVQGERPSSVGLPWATGARGKGWGERY